VAQGVVADAYLASRCGQAREFADHA
jgi:hypothetical protein